MNKKIQKIGIRISLFLASIGILILVHKFFGENAITSSSYIAGLLHLNDFIKEIKE